MMKTADSAASTSATTNATSGTASASVMSAATKPSSARLTSTFENGSGDAFTTTRVAALAPCATNASAAPDTASGTVPAAAVAAVEQERTGDRAEERVHRVPGAVDVRDLVDDELDREQHERGDDHPRALQEVGAVDPVEPPTDAEDRGDGVHADPG